MRYRRKNITLGLAISVLAISSYTWADAHNFVEKDDNGTTEIRAPFVQINVHRKAYGTRNVSVDAPLTHVRSLPGANNVQVSAPFTKVNPKEAGNVHVSAPFTKVTKQPDGSVHTTAPFTDVNKSQAKENIRVLAPPANSR